MDVLRDALYVPQPDHIRAHKHCIHNRAELEASETSGCFYCLKIFPPHQIQGWVDNKSTALCPYCGIDSVIGSVSRFPIEAAFLAEMERYWFG
jgi:hypothetical protein